MKSKRCIALFSGGLDSLLAIKIIQQQGIDVVPVYFNTGFFFNTIIETKDKLIYKLATPSDIKVNVVDISSEFFDIIKKPEYGFGSNMNPCIDCKILMLKKANELRNVYDAGFVITGEVLGQRPMTQNINSMKLIEEKSGLTGFLLRPLCAKNLPETEPEKLKWVDREKLSDLKGRSRKNQLELAKRLGLSEYIVPSAGGCILTDPGYSKRLKDFLLYDKKGKIQKDDLYLLTIGRHFRKNDLKFIIGRNLSENEKLLKYKGIDGINIFDCVDVPGPAGFCRGELTSEEKKFIASAVARYSDGKNNLKVKISITYNNKEEIIETQPLKDEELRKFII